MVFSKAYFKHLTCVEMCDGGHGTESMFSFLGGVTGKYPIGSDYFDKPKEYFEIIKKAKTGEFLRKRFASDFADDFEELRGP